MGFRLGPGNPVRTGAGGPWRSAFALGIVAGSLLVGWLAVTGLVGSGTQDAQVNLDIDPRPIIISLQQIGELHTAKITMKDVLHIDSDRPAQGWLHDVPGGDTLSKWATHNEGLVTAEGSVEAGIDLSRITARDVMPVRHKDGTVGLRVHLPQPVIYPPNVTLRVEKTESGLLWRDENLVPKAQAEASRRFLDAAEKEGIRADARDHALERLRQLQDVVGGKNVEFYF